MCLCARQWGFSVPPPRENVPHDPPDYERRDERDESDNQDQDGAICIFHATHPPLPPASQAQHACVQRYDEGTRDDGGRWPAAAGDFIFGVSSSQVVIAMAKFANAEWQVGLRPAAGGDLFLSAVAGRENLSSWLI